MDEQKGKQSVPRSLSATQGRDVIGMVLVVGTTEEH